VLDEKSIPSSKSEVSWTIGDSIPHSVPPRSLFSSCSVPTVAMEIYQFSVKKEVKLVCCFEAIKEIAKNKLNTKHLLKVQDMNVYLIKSKKGSFSVSSSPRLSFENSRKSMKR
jgi:hypothetical protein